MGIDDFLIQLVKYCTKGEIIFDVPKGIACNLQVTDSIWGGNTALIVLGST